MGIPEAPKEGIFFQGIREARRSQGLTMIELAQRSSLSFELVRSIETGRRVPTLHSLAKLAQGLGCNITVRLEGVEVYIKLINSA